MAIRINLRQMGSILLAFLVAIPFSGCSNNVTAMSDSITDSSETTVIIQNESELKLHEEPEPLFPPRSIRQTLSAELQRSPSEKNIPPEKYPFLCRNLILS